MEVALNTALYRAQGVDLNNVENIAQNILKSASSKNIQVKAIDYSKFNRASLGIDLYSSRTNVNLQKQISLNQTYLYAQSVDVSKLNSKAAANLYSAATVQKNVSMAQSIQNAELTPVKPIEKEKLTTEVFTAKDSNSKSGSETFNPFSHANREETQDNRAN